MPQQKRQAGSLSYNVLQPTEMNPRDLPIYELESDIVAALQKQPRLILQAPTGSGKSTQVPQILLDHGLLGGGQVVILQPRRIAARLLAARVAAERSVRLGQEVGYQVRFENIVSPSTNIRFVTEGILLRQLIQDPELRGISAILFDEFHERHLYSDITLARALRLQETTRPDLKIVVMSATIDTGALQGFLEPCAVLTSTGRQHPVAIEYLPKRVQDDYPAWDLAADELARLASSTTGDVLVFMPGKYEIGRTVAAVRASRVSDQFTTLPLHGELPPAEQDAALAPSTKRKAIIATNVAETSLTIEGVRVVIDSGLARIARFDPRRGINTLLIEKISRASADQRAGRAGRTAPGHCLRLWTEREHQERAAHELPEVKRLDLAEVVLTLKACGIDDLAAFRWLEPPDPRALARAEQLLADLGALSLGDGKITALGGRMLSFPVHPRYARMFLAAADHRCVRAIALIAALTQGRNLLRRPEGKQAREDREDLLGSEDDSDLFILTRAFRFAQRNNFDPRRCGRLSVNAVAAREAAQLADQFLTIAQEEGLPVDENEPAVGAIQRCVLAGFPDQVAMRLDQGTLRCALVHGRRGVLARESVVHKAPLLVASEVREIESSDKERQVLLTLCTRIEEEWLRQLFPEAFSERVETLFDSTQRRVIGRRQIKFHDLVLQSEPIDVAEDQAASLLAQAVIEGTCPLKNWDNSVDQWITRLNWVAKSYPELQFPSIAETDRRLIVEEICRGAFSYKEIKERPVWPAVKSWLNAKQQQQLEELAPERIELPNKRKAKVTYAGNAAPTVAVRIQDLYGVNRNLRIGSGHIPLVIQVLAPNHRPIQITSDLETFWREAYPKIKKELQRKYPKHEWR
ncbi:MAG TPA: ATP-dependent helicase HrpB [Chthoniobacterales bacterium]|nr:ATP-dependent helicase HrpB [Chthoniobacterales bacterium]